MGSEANLLKYEKTDKIFFKTYRKNDSVHILPFHRDKNFTVKSVVVIDIKLRSGSNLCYNMWNYISPTIMTSPFTWGRAISRRFTSRIQNSL